MVAHILRLRLALALGALRGDRRHVRNMVVATLLFVAAVVAVGIAISMLNNRPVATASAMLVTAGSALFVGVCIAPLMGDARDQLDARRFAVHGVNPPVVAASTLLASFISVPSIALIVSLVLVSRVWISLGASTPVAVLSAIGAALTIVLASRVSMLAATLWRVRRTRELKLVFVLIGAMVIATTLIFLLSLRWGGALPAPFARVAEILSLTPFGAIWAAPLAEATGHAHVGWIITVAIATIVVLAGAWFAMVHRALTTIERPIAAREQSGMGWFAVFPATPFGTIAARSLIYWFRDRRYIVNVAIVPIGAIAASLPLLIAGVPFEIVCLLPVPIMALFFGWMPHNDVAYDSTAVWMHVVSGVRGVADRLGRLVPILVIAVPVLGISVPIAIAILGEWSYAPALVGLSANLFLVGLGLSSISSALAPYAVTRPGDSPFQQPQRTGSGMGAQALVLIGTIGASIPTMSLAWQTLTKDPSKSSETFAVGLAIGFGVFVVGVAIGALVFRLRGAKIMEFAESI